MSPAEMSPLFIPLNGEFYDQFIAGTKQEEYRIEGPKWNPKTCPVGRKVLLSRGYGTRHRAKGVITGYRSDKDVANIPGWHACYGDKCGPAACIRIEILAVKEGEP
jgi:hypothetical protein